MSKIQKFTKRIEELNATDFLKNQLHVPRIHDDDRRRSVNDVFPLPENAGEIDLSFIYPNQLVAWHRHQHQSDYWFVLKGSLKVGLYDETNKKLMWVYLHERQRQVLHIPPTIWHGWRNLDPKETILMYWITKKYNLKDPDEERLPAGTFGENWDSRNI